MNTYELREAAKPLGERLGVHPRYKIPAELRDIAVMFRIAERQGADTDQPEGSRFITISDTLALELADAIDRYEVSG